MWRDTSGVALEPLRKTLFADLGFSCDTVLPHQVQNLDLTVPGQDSRLRPVRVHVESGQTIRSHCLLHPEAEASCWYTKIASLPTCGKIDFGPPARNRKKGPEKRITHKRIAEPNFTIFELCLVIHVLGLLNRMVSGNNYNESVSVIITSCGCPNFWVHLAETFWELCSVLLVEALPNRNCFGINSVSFLCVMVFDLPRKQGEDGPKLAKLSKNGPNLGV